DELISLLESSDDAVRLAEAYLRQGDLYTLLRRYDDAEQALNRSLALRRELQDAVGERHTLRSLGLLRWHQDRNREALAYIERAVEIDRERADMEALVGDLSNLGYVLKGMGEHEGARAYLEEGLALSETIQRGENGGGGGAIAGEVAVQRSYLLHNLANVHRELGDDERALEFMLRAQDFARERRLPIQLSYHLTSIAHLHLRHGRVQESLEYYQEAVDLTRRARYASGLAQSLSFLGELMLGLERQAEALPHLLEAAALFGQLRDSASEATMWSRVAGVHEGRNDFAEALAAWGRARSLRQQSGDMAGALEALEGIARATRRHVAEPSLALGYYYEALAMADALADRKTQARLGNTIGILEWSRGAFDVALAQYDRALSLFQVLGDKAGAGLMMNSIGLTLAALGRLDDARMRLEKAITLHHSSGERLLEGHALAALGDVCERMGETSVAQERYEHSLRIRREIGDRRGEGWMLHRLARIHLSLGALGLGRELAARASEAATECSDQELSDACDRLLREPTL
ncbi:MAG: tetratricopeptide repeat protein, partial [Gemmatimonadaceae bacterium]